VGIIADGALFIYLFFKPEQGRRLKKRATGFWATFRSDETSSAGAEKGEDRTPLKT